MPQLIIDNVTKTFEAAFRAGSGLTAVDRVSMVVSNGEVVGLLGPNGAGKTTLLKMICGLITPSGGTIRLGNADISQNRPEILLQLGAVLEGSRNAVWSMTVDQNLRFFGRLKQLSSDVIQNQSRDLLAAFDLAGKRHQLVKTLSKGMKQKLALALAFMGAPSLLLLDEPTSGIDVASTRTMKQRIVDLAKGQGRTVLLATHQMEVAEEICDRIAIFKQGRLLTFVRPGQLTESMDEDLYEIHLDQAVDTTVLERLPVVRSITGQPSEAGSTACVLRLAIHPRGSLHHVIDPLVRMNRRVLFVRHLQKKLEDVFVELVEK